MAIGRKIDAMHAEYGTAAGRAKIVFICSR